MTTVVDIHCHTFNADGLPVHGFVQRVAFHDNLFTDDLSALVDRVLQGRAPGVHRRERTPRRPARRVRDAGGSRAR